MGKKSCLNCKHWKERQFPNWYSTKYKAGVCIYLSNCVVLDKNTPAHITVEEHGEENPFIVPWVITKSDWGCNSFTEKEKE